MPTLRTAKCGNRDTCGQRHACTIIETWSCVLRDTCVARHRSTQRPQGQPGLENCCLRERSGLNPPLTLVAARTPSSTLTGPRDLATRLPHPPPPCTALASAQPVPGIRHRHAMVLDDEDERPPLAAAPHKVNKAWNLHEHKLWAAATKRPHAQNSIKGAAVPRHEQGRRVPQGPPHKPFRVSARSSLSFLRASSPAVSQSSGAATAPTRLSPGVSCPFNPTQTIMFTYGGLPPLLPPVTGLPDPGGARNGAGDT